ncbi:MAG: fluoride exporter, partial [Microbacteriaceae bacterium]|nr:fluoride exporter [Microbacteriaceae bacterium]
MTPLAFLLISIAGGLGSALRLLVDGLVKARLKITFPLGTTIINVTGSFLLGLVTGLATTAVLPAEWQLIIGTGLLGGYTTFSTASFESVRLI